VYCFFVQVYIIFSGAVDAMIKIVIQETDELLGDDYIGFCNHEVKIKSDRILQMMLSDIKDNPCKDKVLIANVVKGKTYFHSRLLAETLMR